MNDEFERVCKEAAVTQRGIIPALSWGGLRKTSEDILCPVEIRTRHNLNTYSERDRYANPLGTKCF
jgi:hypothetical protein